MVPRGRPFRPPAKILPNQEQLQLADASVR